MTTFLSLITSPMALRSPVPEEQVSKVSASASTLFSASRLIALHIAEDALLRQVAPAGVAPHLGFAAQSLHRVVEDLDEIVYVELAEGLAARRYHVDLRLLHLHDRMPASASSLSSALSASLIA